MRKQSYGSSSFQLLRPKGGLVHVNFNYEVRNFRKKYKQSYINRVIVVGDFVIIIGGRIFLSIGYIHFIFVGLGLRFFINKRRNVLKLFFHHCYFGNFLIFTKL
jgi:hypothetical protein